MTEFPTTMTDEARAALAVEYLKAIDNGGVAPSGRGILDLFADDAEVYFPKWGLARGKDEIGRLFGDLGSILRSIQHDYADFRYVHGRDGVLVVEGTSSGEHRDGPWRAGDPAWGAGRWCDVFDIDGDVIRKVSIYLDPDYAGQDTARYPWLS